MRGEDSHPFIFALSWNLQQTIGEIDRVRVCNGDDALYNACSPLYSGAPIVKKQRVCVCQRANAAWKRFPDLIYAPLSLHIPEGPDIEGGCPEFECSMYIAGGQGCMSSQP